jgi:hypothetical protein
MKGIGDWAKKNWTFYVAWALGIPVEQPSCNNGVNSTWWDNEGTSL